MMIVDSRLGLLVLTLFSLQFNPTAGFPWTIGYAPASARPCAKRELRHSCSCLTFRPNSVQPIATLPQNSMVAKIPYSQRSQGQVPATAGENCDHSTNDAESPPLQPLAVKNPQVELFEGWTKQAGCGGIALLSHADFEGLRGLVTKDTVAPWQSLTTLPLSTALIECASFPSRYPSASPEPLSSKVWEICPWWVRLGVRLLIEKALGEASILYEYIRVLPELEGLGVPLCWSAEQLDRMYYPRLRAQAAVQRRLFQGYRKFLLADATNNSGSARAHDDFLKSLADESEFNWALQCVLSRAFQLPPENAKSLLSGDGKDFPEQAPETEPPTVEEARMGLLPWIDSINHYSRIPTHMYWEGNEVIGVSVGMHLDPGDQAFLSYGPISNDDLLQYYGFVERDNPHDTYVLQDMGKWLRADGWLDADLTVCLLACPAAKDIWRYLRRGVLLRDMVHPTTMQAMRIVFCERQRGVGRSAESAASNPYMEGNESPWDRTERDLERFKAPISLASENAALELIMRYCALEADAWGDAGVAAALADDPTAPGLDDDLDGLGLNPDQRLMLSVFRQEKLCLLRGIISRLTHLRKMGDLLKRPIKLPPLKHTPTVLGTLALGTACNRSSQS